MAPILVIDMNNGYLRCIADALVADAHGAFDLAEFKNIVRFFNAICKSFLPPENAHKFSADNLSRFVRGWERICTILEILDSAGRLEVFDTPEVIAAQEHNFGRTLTSSISISWRTARFLVRRLRVGQSQDANLDIRLRTAQLSIKAHRESVKLLFDRADQNNRDLLATDIHEIDQHALVIRNAHAYFCGALGVLVQMSVRRLVTKSAMRKFPMELVRRVAALV